MSSELDPTINGRSISELKVVELKEELSKRGLSKAGNKNVLYDRLKKFLLDESGDANVTLESVDSSQTSDTPNSPPANPLVAEYLAKQEAALREARKDAEAALRSSSGDETSPSPKKVLRSRKSAVSNADTEDTVVERRTTRSKTRSEVEQAQETKVSGKLAEVRREVKTLVSEVDSAKGESLDVPDTGRTSKKAESGESKDQSKEVAETTIKSDQNVGGEVVHEAQKASEVADPSASTGAVDKDTKDKTNLTPVVDASFDATTVADANVDATSIVSSENGVSTPDVVDDTANVTDNNVGVKSSVSDGISASTHIDAEKDGDTKIETEPISTTADSVVSINTTSTGAADVSDDASGVTQDHVEKSSGADEREDDKIVENINGVQESEVKTEQTELVGMTDTLEKAKKTVNARDKGEKNLPNDKEKPAEISELKCCDGPEKPKKSFLTAVSGTVENNEAHTAAVSDLELMEVDKETVEETLITTLQKPQTSHSESEVAAPESSSVSEKVLQGTILKTERKRRWKETSSSQDSNDDKDIITVSATTTKTEILLEPEETEYSDVDEKPVLSEHQQNEFDAKETMLGAGEKDEELDYEEALEHISPTSESSKPVKAGDEETIKRAKNEESEKEHNTVSTKFERRHEVQNKKRTSEVISNSQEKRDSISEDGGKRRKVSPARYPVSEYLLIRQLTRPFTVKQLKGMLGNYGTLVEDGFWIDNIKSKCIVKYSSKEEATVARGNLHNFVWPLGNPKELKVDFIDKAGFERFSRQDLKEDIKGKANGSISAQPSVSLRVSAANDQRLVQKKQEGQGDNHEAAAHSNTKSDRSPSSRHESGHGYDSSLKRQDSARIPQDYHRNEPETKAKTADELFQKTRTQPAIYFSPLTDEQILERAKQKASEAETSLSKRTTQASRNERHKDEDSEKDNKYRLSPWRRQKSPSGQKKRRPSRSRSPRRP